MDERLSQTSRKFRSKFRKLQKRKLEKDLIKELFKKEKLSWLWEFMKKILFMMTVLYCVERVYAMAIMLYTMNMDYLGTFIESGADVFKAGVIFYAVKAGIENVTKIKLSGEEISKDEPDGEEQEENDNAMDY